MSEQIVEPTVVQAVNPEISKLEHQFVVESCNIVDFNDEIVENNFVIAKAKVKATAPLKLKKKATLEKRTSISSKDYLAQHENEDGDTVIPKADKEAYYQIGAEATKIQKQINAKVKEVLKTDECAKAQAKIESLRWDVKDAENKLDDILMSLGRMETVQKRHRTVEKQVDMAKLLK